MTDTFQYNVEDYVLHRKYGVGQIVRKTGPTKLRTFDEVLEPMYAVQFRDRLHPSIYAEELRPGTREHYETVVVSHGAKQSQSAEPAPTRG